MSEDKWTKDLPQEIGSYWFAIHKHVRIVNVWGNGVNRYINEDGGGNVTDNIYNGGHWMGPIKPPEPPTNQTGEKK